MVSSDGGVFTFGDAPFYGSMGGTRLTQPVVAMAADPATGGYWLVASDGGVFSFDAPFYGSTGAIRLNQPVVGMAATPSGHGYWLVAADGGIFTFGDAKYYGSMGATHLNRPVVGMAASPSGQGYWLVASDGGIFTFGDAPFMGSTGSVHLNRPITGMAPSPSGSGYWLVASDGGLFTFGDAPYLGSTGSYPGPAPVVSISPTAHGYPFPPGSKGYDISQYQCHNIPPAPQSISIVQVTGGAITNKPNPCYAQEAAWAGNRLSVYIFMDGMPSPAPSYALSGPAGNCNRNVNCESFNFGWFWGNYWASYSHSQGIHASFWWLDVETSGSWNTSATAQPSNANVIAGAVGALRANSIVAGIYSTALQWGKITGNLVNFPGISLWMPGAGNISGGTFSAQNFCNGSVPPQYGYSPFAQGKIVLVQYGYGPEYSGSPSSYDQDYACPA
jgi:ribosomal protein L24E